MSDAIHATLADVQAFLTTSHSAESPDGTVRAEATAKRQTALHLTQAALRMNPEALATMILKTQREAQTKAEEAVTGRLDTFRKDPRVTSALETLRDIQATPAPRPTPTSREEDPEPDFTPSVYDKNQAW